MHGLGKELNVPDEARNARLPVVIEGSGFEVLSDDLLTAGESVAAAHWVIMPDRMTVHEGAAVAASSADNV